MTTIQTSPYFIDLDKSDHLPEPEVHVLKVKVSVPELGEASAALIFDVMEDPSGGGVPPAQEIVSLTRGGAIPVPDNRLSVRFSSYGTATAFAGGIAIPRSTPVSVSLFIASQVPGDFIASITVADGSSWAALQLSGGTPQSPTVVEFRLSEEPLTITISVGMLPGDAAAGNTDLIFTLQSKTDSPKIDPPIEEIYRIPVYIQG